VAGRDARRGGRFFCFVFKLLGKGVMTESSHCWKVNVVQAVQSRGVSSFPVILEFTILYRREVFFFRLQFFFSPRRPRCFNQSQSQGWGVALHPGMREGGSTQGAFNVHTS